MAHSTILIAIFLMVTLLAVAGVVVFRRFWRGPSKVRDAAMNLLLMGCTLAYLCLGLEVYFYQFSVQSEGFGVAMGTKRFIALNFHWNSLGYRDFEQTAEDFAGKHALVVVGDSFAAGNGIANQGDRFSDQLAMHLGDGWRVGNIAKGGWDTVRELKELKSYPFKPEVVVLSYYVNDIQHAVESEGLEFLGTFPKPSGVLKPIVEHSYLANVIFWRFCRVRVQMLEENFWDGLKAYYAREDIWNIHAQELDNFARYCKENDISLFAVLFPNFLSVEDSKSVTKQVGEHLATLGVPALDLAPVFSGRDPTEMVVNKLDAHPNEGVHREVGALLYTFLAEHGALGRIKK